MPKQPPQTPMQALFDRNEGLQERATEITGLSNSSIDKARYEEQPKGWKALVIEVDRLHRIGREVDRAHIELLKARINELKNRT